MKNEMVGKQLTMLAMSNSNFAQTRVAKLNQRSRNAARAAVVLLVAFLLSIASPLWPSVGVSSLSGSALAASSKIRAIVNRQAITNNDIARRRAFLKLRRVKGNLSKKARDELVEEALQMQEARRIGAVASDAQVNKAYAGFAKSNKMSQKQLGQVLSRSGVTTRGFKDYIRAQISWQRSLAARAQAEGGGVKSATRDRLAELHSSGRNKPRTTEYLLQQVIFVIPKAKRSRIIAKRRAEARAFRNRFRSCQSTQQFAKGLRDVTVRDLGRVLKPQLPERWKKEVSRLSTGKTTPVKDTEKGVEFLAVCKSRVVSDDKAAELSFAAANGESGGAKALSEKYMKELRKVATIKLR